MNETSTKIVQPYINANTIRRNENLETFGTDYKQLYSILFLHNVCILIVLRFSLKQIYF